MRDIKRRLYSKLFPLRFRIFTEIIVFTPTWVDLEYPWKYSDYKTFLCKEVLHLIESNFRNYFFLKNFHKSLFSFKVSCYYRRALKSSRSVRTVYKTSFESKCCSGFKQEGSKCIKGENKDFEKMLNRYPTVSKNNLV